VTATATVTTTAVPEIIELIKFETHDGRAIDFDGNTITNRVHIIGSVSSGLMDHWTLEYKSAGDTAWTVLNSSVSPVDNAILALFDPTMLLNGIYELKLSLHETNGVITSIKSPAFVVEGNLKIGNFTLSFTDLSVPVAGVPLEVVRSYDSRVKTKGDFGIGWTLDIKNMRVEESCVQGESWNCFINPIIYHQGLLKIKPLRSHLVSITVPGGKVYRFEALPNPSYNIVSMESPFNIKYTQLGGKGALLRPLDMTGNVLAYGEAPGNFTFVDSSSFAIYDPNLYELTTQDGTKYVISQSDGLISMEDLNGNKLTIDANGIHHTSGKDISFTRDSEDRITRITAPDGTFVNYTYNGDGILETFADQLLTDPSQTSKLNPAPLHPYSIYTYNPGTSQLISIEDPRGEMPIRNDYDPITNRLVSHRDAAGNYIYYTHDIDSKTDSTLDRDGAVTTFKYDDRGNITEISSPAGVRSQARVEF
nr:DUF6531 domain-containing protein [Candidatus Goldiibacteriota bacterium]